MKKSEHGEEDENNKKGEIKQLNKREKRLIQVSKNGRKRTIQRE